MRQSKESSLSQLLYKSRSPKSTSADASAQLMALLDATPDAFIIIDKAGNIELSNRSLEHMFLYTSEELLGQNVEILVPKSLRDKHSKYLKNYSESGQSNIVGKTRRLQACKSTGEEFPILLSVGEVKHASHAQFVGIIRDLSESVSIENALSRVQEKLYQASKMSSMGELAAGIAHELNQPLSAISSYAQASKRLIHTPDKDHTETISETLDKICDQAQRASEVIKRLKTLIKHHISERRTFNIHDLIIESMEIIDLEPGISSSKIDLLLDKTTNAKVSADPIQIQQVMMNLIRNAFEAMQNSHPQQLTIKTTIKESNKIEVSVIDQGKGLDDYAIESLFTPFYTTKENGMGVGLSICQSIIHAHGGHVHYKPNSPTGCIFSFSLPLVSAAN